MQIYKEGKTRTAEEDESLFASVKQIISDVRAQGDAALSRYNEKFGGVPTASFRVTDEELDQALGGISPELRAAIEKAASNIKRFAELQLDCSRPLEATETEPGVFLGHRVIPVDSCCCYVPGGNHPLFSTALMLVIPARVAGVRRVCAAVPPL